MKLLPIACLAFLEILYGVTQAQTADPADYLRAEMTMTAEDGGSSPALRKLRLLPPDQQLHVVEAVIQEVNDISTKSDTSSPGDANYIRVAAELLRQVGTDEQIIQAFGELANFGHSESDAAEVLSSCKGIAGVEIIRKLAEERLSQLESAINPKNEEERALSNKVLIPFHFLLIHLEGAKNSGGSLAAKRLRDQVAARYPSENGKSFVAMLDKEMAKTRSRKSNDRSSSMSSPTSSSPGSVKTLETDNQNTFEHSQPPSHEQPDISVTYKVAAIITIIFAVSVLAWRLMRKRDS